MEELNVGLNGRKLLFFMVRWNKGVEKLAEKKEKEEDEDVWMQRGDGLKPRALQ